MMRKTRINGSHVAFMYNDDEQLKADVVLVICYKDVKTKIPSWAAKIQCNHGYRVFTILVM